MTKPNDVPQDIDAIASAIVLKDRSSEHEPDFALYSDIARAIMAEREACAQVAEKATRTTYMAWDMDCLDPVEARIEYREMIAEAIRNRT